MELRDRNVLVVGFERTGEALCRFLLDRGARVRVTEKKPAEALGERMRDHAGRGVVFETGGHQAASFLGADLIVPSPGVPPIPELAAARAKGVPVISEIELAYLFLRGRIVGITGSNGKSTTATLVHEILKGAGLRSRLAGNIGTPLISFVDRSRDDDIYVAEISSFQLEYAERFTPAVAAILNVSENHLDWHGTFECYFAAKKKLVLRQGPDGVAVLNRDDPRIWGLRSEARSQVYGFSLKRRPAQGAFIDDGWIVVKDGPPERILPAAAVRLPGAHNLENVLAASLIGRLLGAPAASMRRTIGAFRGLEHRLEDVLRSGASASSTTPRRRPSTRPSRPWPASTGRSSSSSAAGARAGTSRPCGPPSASAPARSSSSARRPARSRPRSAASSRSSGP
jgi:UDP-N-acetylmuramoylalanine--D-glutamate ligase